MAQVFHADPPLIVSFGSCCADSELCFAAGLLCVKAGSHDSLVEYLQTGAVLQSKI